MIYLIAGKLQIDLPNLKRRGAQNIFEVRDGHEEDSKDFLRYDVCLRLVAPWRERQGVGSSRVFGAGPPSRRKLADLHAVSPGYANGVPY